MSAKSNAPIIVKKKKVIAGGHHGGAWKVAYADFVTAMMAFFLLMWLLNATTEKQRKGVADYFNPTIPVNRISGGGEGAFGGDSVFTEEELAQNGTGATMEHAAEQHKAKGEKGETGAKAEESDAAADAKAFTEAQEALMGKAGESMASDMLLRRIVTRVTDEGLIIEFFDLEGEPLFERGTNTPTPIMTELALMLGSIVNLANNRIAVNGFIATQPIVAIDSRVWDLSQSRADISRQLLVQSGVDEMRVQRVTGFADRKPAARNPMAARNNRVEIILLRSTL